MNPNQFRVTEHQSYDMIGTWYYAAFRDPRRTIDSKERMRDFVSGTVEPLYCELRLFPDYEFNANEFAKR
jgi:hypothetical protein